MSLPASFFAGVLPAVISGATGLFNAGAARTTSINNTSMTNKANMELAKYGYSKDLEMWNRQNEYNSPESQMMRYEKAGLNPKLIYGQGTPGNAQTMPKYNVPKMDFSKQLPMQLPDVIGQYQNIALNQAKLDNTQQTIKQTEANTAFTNIQKQIADTKLAIDKSSMDDVVKQRQYKALNSLEDNAIKKNTQSIQEQILEEKKHKVTQAEYDAAFKENRAYWAKLGVFSSDNLAFRFIYNSLYKMGVVDDGGMVKPGKTDLREWLDSKNKNQRGDYLDIRKEWRHRKQGNYYKHPNR